MTNEELTTVVQMLLDKLMWQHAHLALHSSVLRKSLEKYYDYDELLEEAKTNVEQQFREDLLALGYPADDVNIWLSTHMALLKRHRPEHN